MSGFRKVAQIAIVVHDLDRAKAFYRDTLGLSWSFDAPPGMSFFQCGETRLMLTLPLGVESGRSFVYYDVAAIEETCRALKVAGVSFASDPHLLATVGGKDIWLAECQDPDGNFVGLMSERETVVAA